MKSFAQELAGQQRLMARIRFSSFFLRHCRRFHTKKQIYIDSSSTDYPRRVMPAVEFLRVHHVTISLN
jgi:hypothetical protein